jgi:hypothetical protein
MERGFTIEIQKLPNTIFLLQSIVPQVHAQAIFSRL